MLAAVVSHPPAARAPRVQAAHVAVARRCYAVGDTVAVRGTGFAAASPFDIAIDGVDFGQSLTNAAGAFSAALAPGGLGAGQFQIVDTLIASDGARRATTRFTVTRDTGALFGNGSGGSPERKVPFDVWDFAPTGPPVNVYLHYVSPSGAGIATAALGATSGQCGALVTAPRALFPFSPSAGTWTLQFDTLRGYRANPSGRVARVKVSIS